jgi:DNA-binding CsgD family transcriptional regulator
MAGRASKERLRGRREECTGLRTLISAASAGESQVLVLRGEAGVGKTALLDWTARRATAFHRIAVAGVESDMELAYAGLQQLCAPLLRHLDVLPEPQRGALDVAFGRDAGDAPDRFLVGLAVLSLMAVAADEQPLLCVVDDAQWLDQVSLQTLAFVARRLLAEPVAMVFAVRDRTDVLAGLPELELTGISDAEARDLLDAVMVGGIDPRVRDRIVAETRGIPLAILEVPRSVTPTELSGGFWISGKRSSTAAIETDFVRRIQSLPEPTARLLLLAAAEPVGDPALFLRAAQLLDIPVDALAPAEATGIIEFGARMRFSHPLMRSAAYRAADLLERRAIHGALAQATDPGTDPDRRAWHAANAASGPDDAVAAELEASASRAQSRGGVAAAATFLERATTLTADPALRATRALAAAHAKRDAAAPADAYQLLAIADMGRLTDLQQAQAARLRAQMDFVRSRSGEAGAVRTDEAAMRLHEAALALDDLDGEEARETHLEALTAAMYAGRLGDPGRLMAVAQAGRTALARLNEVSRPPDLLLSGLTDRIIDGPGAGLDHMRAGLECWNPHEAASDAEHRSWPFPIAQESAAHELWDDAVLRQIATDTVRRARDAGALAALPAALAYRAGVHVYMGEFNSAAALLDEVDTITASIGYAPRKYHALNLAAWRGVPDEATAAIAEAAADGLAKGEGRLIGLTKLLTAIVSNSLGRYDEALAAAWECCQYEDLGFFGWSLYELIEAAVHAGDDESAAWALEPFEQRAGASGTDWGLGMVAAARAMVADDATTGDLFAEADERLERAKVALHSARVRLCYGEWLRRAKRRADARTELGAAHEMFTTMGAHGFAERARRELAATGEKVRRQPLSTGDALTPQEAQIARLAADGLTNQEIGAQLFLSTHTAEWHLRKVFVKLGITSRRQLRTVSWAG